MIAQEGHLKNYWYAAGTSKDVGVKKPIKRIIFNIPIVFTTFGRTKFADKFIKVAIKTLHSKGIG